MNKFRTLLPAGLLMAAVIFSSCSDDDLDKRLDKLENTLGTNEPLKVDFATTNYNDVAIAKETSFKFKSLDNDEAIWDLQNGSYYVYIERFSDIDWNQGGWIEFYYNPTSKEVTDAEGGVYFYDQYSYYNSYNFYEDNGGNTVDLEVTSFNAETGKISVNFVASTDASAGNNVYEGKAMTISMKFSGKLRVFKGGL